MKFTATSIAASALTLASLVSAQSATINTPTQLFTCEPAAITWNGGTGPYYVRVYEGGSTTALIETLQSSVSTNSYTWNVDVPAGQSVTLGLTDSTGATVYSAEVTVTEGSSTACVGGAGASSGASSAAPAASSAAPAASSAAATASSAASSAASPASSAASRATSAASSAASAASSAAAPSSSASGNSGASTLTLSGLAGVAALGAALLA
ncbi:hypothetical protein JCM10450v2_007787 [Rhodotorula kratochvilovae]